MPLLPGKSKKVITKNALEMMKAGHARDQSWAAAFANARRKRKKKR